MGSSGPSASVASLVQRLKADVNEVIFRVSLISKFETDAESPPLSHSPITFLLHTEQPRIGSFLAHEFVVRAEIGRFVRLGFIFTTILEYLVLDGPVEFQLVIRTLLIATGGVLVARS